MSRYWGGAAALARSVEALIRETQDFQTLQRYFDIGYRAGGTRAGNLMARRGFVLWTGTQLIGYNLGREHIYQSLSPQQQQRLQYAVNFLNWARGRESTVSISRGDGETSDARCWEHVIGAENVKKLDKKKRELCQKNGMLLQDIAEMCEPYKVGDEEILVLRNKDVKIAFAFLIVEQYRVGSCTEYPNDKYDLLVVHPYPVDLTKD